MELEYNVMYNNRYCLFFKCDHSTYLDIIYYSYHNNTGSYIFSCLCAHKNCQLGQLPYFLQFTSFVPQKQEFNYSQPQQSPPDKGIATFAGEIAQQELQILTNKLDMIETNIINDLENKIKKNCCGLF